RFAQSRAFELVALQATLKRTLDLSKSRAFQKTPRYLRRRAASHNPRKVPRRLRERAMRELENDPVTPKKRKPKALRRKPRSDYLSRQVRNGTWLETHLWMAKRFHMRAMWGFKVALRPTQKGARSMYRAAKYASVVHDASYQSVYEFSGPQEHVAQLVQAVIDPAGPRVGAARYMAGKRSVSVEVFDVACAATDTFGGSSTRAQLLGPATALWQPLANTASSSSAMDTDNHQPTRTLWLWTHPLIDERLLASLAHIMDTRGITTVNVTQLTDLCKLTLVGPKSFGLVHSTLKLAPTTSADQQAQWRSLAGLTDPSTLPKGGVLAVDIWDPRLSYPPARPTYTRTSDQQQGAHATLLHMASATATAPESTLWNATSRLHARQGKVRDHELHARKHAQLVPGTRLQPNPDRDSTIPLLLIASATGDGALDLVLPRGWSLPVWRTLVWAGARPAGLACMRSLAHEAGRAYFPWDYPTTSGYIGVVSHEADEQKQKWMSRPSGKRVNYEKLMVDAPFMPQW
ncbi:ribonucleases P/MRP protein subunit POP1-domain-containing protein, partial [Catenaria anguillulae PL171]